MRRGRGNAGMRKAILSVGKKGFHPIPLSREAALLRLPPGGGGGCGGDGGMQGYTKRLVERCLFDMVLDMKMQFARMRIAFSAFLDKKEGARRELRDHFWTF